MKFNKDTYTIAPDARLIGYGEEYEKAAEPKPESSGEGATLASFVLLLSAMAFFAFCFIF